MRGLALVEFLADDPFRQYRTEWFPFLLGLGRARGADVRWLTLQAGRDSRLAENYFVVEPPAADVALLLAALVPHDPATVILNDRPGPALASALAEALPGARVLVSGDDTPRYDEPLVGQVLDWLGVPDEAATAADLLSDHAVPDYASVTLNPGRVDARHFTWIKAGLGCTYASPLCENPHFREVDVEALQRTAGCSFCQGTFRGPTDVRRATPRTPAVDLAVLQVRRYLETAPPERRSCRFVFDSAAAFAHVSELIERVLALSPPPTELRFARRADEVLARADDLERWLPRLADGGHRLVLWCMGVETFSPVENERLNKGLPLERYEAALARVRAWERRWPGTVPFSEDGGPSTILFSPWTTLDDLRANVAAGRRLGLDEAFLFSTRLTLIPGTAVAELARRDGLLVPAFVEPFLVIDCPLVFWDLRELPWRFAHPEVDTVFRLLIRLTDRTLSTDAAYVPAGDPLWVRLGPLRDRLSRGSLGFLDAFAALIEAAGEHPGALPEAVLEAFAAGVEAQRPAPSPATDHPAPSPATHEPRSASAPPTDPPAPRPSLGFRRALATALRLSAPRLERGTSARPTAYGQDGTGVFAAIELTTRDGTVLLRFYEGRGDGASFVAGRHSRVVHDAATPVRTPGQERQVRLLLHQLDGLLERLGGQTAG